MPGWVLKVDSFGCLVPGCQLMDATVEEGGPEIGISIYPNPSSDFLNFYLQTPSPARKASFRIVNEQGQIVKPLRNVDPNTTVIVPVYGWQPGMYLLQYLEENQVIVSKQFLKI